MRIRRHVGWLGKKITKDKELGGLGLCSLKVSNIALLIKWWWRYKLQENDLLRRFIDSVHKTPRTWPIVRFNKTIAGVWGTIANLENQLLSNTTLGNVIKGKVGDGGKIRFWIDPWQDKIPLKNLFPVLFAEEKLKSCVIKDWVKLNGTELHFEWVWKRARLSDGANMELQTLLQKFVGFRFGSGQDTWEWAVDGAMDFSVAIVKKLLKVDKENRDAAMFEWISWAPLKWCPGVLLGSTMAVMLLARLIQGFTWELPPNEPHVDLKENLQNLWKAKPLLALAKPRLPRHLYPTS